MTQKYIIREAIDSDIPAILHIYNIARPLLPQVELENRKQWLQDTREMGYPVIIASTAGATGELVAYASLGPYQPYPEFRSYVPCDQF